jgi:hypothetical protein
MPPGAPMPMMPPMPQMPAMACPMGMPGAAAGMAYMPMPVPVPAVPAPKPASAGWTLRHGPDAIQISGPDIEGVCDSVSYSGEGDWVTLEGHVKLKTGNGCLKADKVSINLEDGSFKLEASKPAKTPAVECPTSGYGICY